MENFFGRGDPFGQQQGGMFGGDPFFQHQPFAGPEFTRREVRDRRLPSGTPCGQSMNSDGLSVHQQSNSLRRRLETLASHVPGRPLGRHHGRAVSPVTGRTSANLRNSCRYATYGKTPPCILQPPVATPRDVLCGCTRRQRCLVSRMLTLTLTNSGPCHLMTETNNMFTSVTASACFLLITLTRADAP